MAILRLYSVRDVVAGTFGRPFVSQSNAVAVRSIGDEINRASSDSILQSHPSDFELFFLGEFNDENGRFAPLADLERVVRCADLVKPADVISEANRAGTVLRSA